MEQNTYNEMQGTKSTDLYKQNNKKDNENNKKQTESLKLNCHFEINQHRLVTHKYENRPFLSLRALF